MLKNLLELNVRNKVFIGKQLNENKALAIFAPFHFKRQVVEQRRAESPNMSWVVMVFPRIQRLASEGCIRVRFSPGRAPRGGS